MSLSDNDEGIVVVPLCPRPMVAIDNTSLYL